jgi:hypothetical protein
VHDGVDAGLLDDPRDHRVADVGADELDGADVLRWGDDVDPHHPLDAGIRDQAAREEASEVPGHPGHEDDSRHGLLLHVTGHARATPDSTH